jgi:ADP-heptose:LPS heptosyltransferase
MPTLLYHTGAIGDFVTTIPAIRYYRKQNPGKKITLLGRETIGKFALDIGLIENWIDVDSKTALPLFYDSYSPEADAILKRFSAALLFIADDAPLLKHIQTCGIRSVLHQTPFPTSKIHIVDYHLSLMCDPEKIDPARKIPVCTPSPESIQAAQKILGNLKQPVAIHPGSGSANKNWPFERFLSLGDLLRKHSLPIVWIQGPAEESFQYPETDLIVKNCDLPILAALLKGCRAYIGNDSGITHLAAAAGCPITIALFGSKSNETVWAPTGNASVVILPDHAEINKVLLLMDVLS